MVSTQPNHKTFWLLAYPLILSSIATPLLGVTDTVVIGQSGDPRAIGGIAVGAVFFNTIYWLFGFLKVSTTGFSAQASGANDVHALRTSLYRPLFLAACIGLLILLFRQPLEQIGLYLLAPPVDLLDAVKTYISYRMIGAPFVLMGYALLGWLIGTGQVKHALFVQLFSTGVNVVLDIGFVYGLDAGVAGIAVATVIAEISIVVCALYLIRGHLAMTRDEWRALTAWQAYRQFFQVNRDLFIRTIFLLLVTGWFTRAGGQFGPDVLAANAILLQIQYLISYWFGGLGHASTVLVGRARGHQDQEAYRTSVRLARTFGFYSVVFWSLVLLFLETPLLQLFTSEEAILNAARDYYFWIIILPLLAGWAMIYEGIFAGRVEATPVRNSMIQAGIGFAVVLLLTPTFENQGVWAAFLTFFLIRSLSLILVEAKQ